VRVCVRVRVRVYVCVCVCLRAFVCLWECVGVRGRVCVPIRVRMLLHINT